MQEVRLTKYNIKNKPVSCKKLGSPGEAMVSQKSLRSRLAAAKKSYECRCFVEGCTGLFIAMVWVHSILTNYFPPLHCDPVNSQWTFRSYVNNWTICSIRKCSLESHTVSTTLGRLHWTHQRKRSESICTVVRSNANAWSKSETEQGISLLSPSCHIQGL